MAARAIDGIAAQLGDKPWLMGTDPCGADATAFAFLANTMCPLFESSSRRLAERHANLLAYRSRGLARWYPSMT